MNNKEKEGWSDDKLIATKQNSNHREPAKLNTNRKSDHLQRRIKKYTEQVDSFSFFNLLTSPQLYSVIEDLLPEYRERTFPPTETLSMFLSQAMSADRSCQNIVNPKSLHRVAKLVETTVCRSNFKGYTLKLVPSLINMTIFIRVTLPS